jgi:hypothetical protein
MDSGPVHPQDHQEFVKGIERDFFEPRRQSLPIGCGPIFLGILAMAELFVTYDQLRSERRVREYCVNAGKVSLLPQHRHRYISDTK